MDEDQASILINKILAAIPFCDDAEIGELMLSGGAALLCLLHGREAAAERARAIATRLGPRRVLH
jgi:hypothetical protein